MSRIEQAKSLVCKHGAQFALEVLVNFVLPLGIYDLVKPGHGEVQGLIASSAPPILWSLVEFARARRVDAVSLLVLGGIALSLLAFVGGGGVKVLQVREKLVTVAIAFVFLGSAAIGRPLIYELARAGLARRSPDELAEFEGLKNNSFFKRGMMVMTLAWGFGLLADAAASVALVYAVSVRTYLVIGPLLGYGAIGSLGLWTFWYSRRQRRIGRARRAARLQAEAEPGSAAGSKGVGAQWPP